jgi:hypothetical protein
MGTPTSELSDSATRRTLIRIGPTAVYCWSNAEPRRYHPERITMTRASYLLPISAAVAAMLALSACNKRDDQTVGQSVDRGVASAKAEVKDAKEATKDAAANVGAVVTDATITTKINAALVADDQLKALKINVDTKDGQVVLTGAAPDAVSRDRATTMAKAVDGVLNVDNRLTLQSKG